MIIYILDLDHVYGRYRYATISPLDPHKSPDDDTFFLLYGCEHKFRLYTFTLKKIVDMFDLGDKNYDGS